MTGTLAFENLNGLHGEEERLRALGLAAAKANPALADHLELVGEAMDLVVILGRGYPEPNSQQQVVQLLGIRLFNAGATALKLALAGYYQAGFSLIRDLLETTHLLDYFLHEPSAIAIWQAGGAAAKKKFQPQAVREVLDKRDGFAKGKRAEIYQRYCVYASHPTYAGVLLVAPSPHGLATYGPFLDESTLGHLLVDLAKFLMHGTLVFGRHFENSPSAEMVSAIARFHGLAGAWGAKHLTSSPDP